MPNPSFSPTYEAPDFKSPVGVSRVAEITPSQAARGLGNKLPYSGGAMATHVHMGIPESPIGYQAKNVNAHLKPTHTYGEYAGQGPHTIHDPRFVG